MGQLKIIEGDLLDASETFLCHQTNCVSNGAAHLAASVFKKFPYANIYKDRTTPDEPGTIIIKGNGQDKRFIVNVLAQYYPGCKYPDSKKDGRVIRAEWFSNCLIRMEHLSGSFAFPWRIGCGAAGGDWLLYMDMIEDFSESIKDNVVIYRLPNETE